MEKNIINYLRKKIATGALITYLTVCGAGCMETHNSEKISFSGRNPSNNFIENLIVDFTKPLSGCLEGTIFDSGKNKTFELNIFPDPWSSGYVDEQRRSSGDHGIIWYPLFPPEH